MFVVSVKVVNHLNSFLSSRGGGGRGWKGGTGSADPHNFSAKSTDRNFFKVESESAKSSAENEQKSFSIRLFMLEFCSTMNTYIQH